MNFRAPKKILSWLLKVITAGILSIIILSFVGFFYSYTGVHVTNESEATDYIWESEQYICTMTEGYAWFQMDKNGFNNVVVKEDVDILLMGSSHMEAMQMYPEENTGYILNALLDDFYTYNIGVSGHTIYRLVDNISNALKEYTPSSYVILETSTVKLDVNSMKAVIDGSAPSIPSHDDGVIYYLQKIPAFKPIYNQLSVWIEKDMPDSRIGVETQEPSGQEYKLVLKEFLSMVSESAKAAKVTPIIFFAPPEVIGEDGNPKYSVNKEDLEIYKVTCEELGIVFIDMTESFEVLFASKNTLAHGFVNSAIGVGHLNKYGHKAIAETLANAIGQMEEK